MKGSEIIAESSRTNGLIHSTFTNQTALNTWTADSGLTATLGGVSLYNQANEVNLSASSSNVALWRTLTSTAVARAISVYVRKTDGSAVTSSDMQLTALAGSSTPVGSLLTTTFTQQGTSSTYRATAIYTGTAATWAVGVALMANKSVIIACPQEEVGAYQTSYIPTTSTAVTRNWDKIEVPTSNWSQEHGSVFTVSGKSLDAAGQSGKFKWASDDNSNYIYMYSNSSSGAMYYIRINSVNYIDNSSIIGNNYVQTVVWTNSYINNYLNSNIVGSSNATTSALTGLTSSAFIGSSMGTYGPWNGPIQRVVVYSSALSGSDVSTTTNSIKNGP